MINMKLSGKKIALSVSGLFLLFLCFRYWGNVVALLNKTVSASAPLLLGCVIAYGVNILMSFYERGYDRITEKKRGSISKKTGKIKRPLCMIAAFLTLFLIVYLVIMMVVPELVRAITVLIYKVPGQIDSLIGGVDDTSTLGQKITELYNTYIGSSAQLQKMIESIIHTVRGGLMDGVRSMAGKVTTIFSSIVLVVIGTIFSIYLLLDKEHLLAQIRKLMETYVPKICDKTFYVFGVLNSCFHSFVVGQCLEAVILGTLCTLGMLIFRFPYALMIGALIGFTALIPVAGAYIGAVVGALMMLTDTPKTALFFIIFILILQQLENNLIYPKVVGGSIGLSGIWVLAAVTVGGGVMGVAGMLIAVPLFAAVYRIVQADMKKREEKSEEQETVEETV